MGIVSTGRGGIKQQIMVASNSPGIVRGTPQLMVATSTPRPRPGQVVVVSSSNQSRQHYVISTSQSGSPAQLVALTGGQTVRPGQIVQVPCTYNWTHKTGGRLGGGAIHCIRLLRCLIISVSWAPLLTFKKGKHLCKIFHLPVKSTDTSTEYPLYIHMLLNEKILMRFMNFNGNLELVIKL